MIDGKKVLFSGMQSTGSLTLGNYLGALKNWVKLADEYQCFYCVVDEHSITVRQDPAVLRKRARALLILYIAAGIDPEKSCLYYQSHVSAHAEALVISNAASVIAARVRKFLMIGLVFISLIIIFGGKDKHFISIIVRFSR